MKDISRLVDSQRKYFNSGETKDIKFRVSQLKKLKKSIKNNEEVILNALCSYDLKKPAYEAYASEIAIVLKELEYAIDNVAEWSRPKEFPTPLVQWPSSAMIYPEPYGVALIIGPWNYPLQLMMNPLIGAIAAGNCAILKPSEIAPAASRVLTDIITDTFEPNYVSVVEGDAVVAQELLSNKFDYIFYTGSTNVGKIVMKCAAENLTPVTLELGGKSPCIVDSEVDLKAAAKRIVWGKFFNAGQTCIAPDYVLANNKIKGELLNNLAYYVKRFYGNEPWKGHDYARIINKKHYSRLIQLLSEGSLVIGGDMIESLRYISPTILTNIKLDSKLMQEEIFGPILPIIGYNNLEDAIYFINQKPKPLALYIFSKNKKLQSQVLSQTSSGGVGINETLVHFSLLPSGGVGSSGIGKYHGKASFDTFSHEKGVFDKSLKLDLTTSRFPPYSKSKLLLLKLLRRFM